MFKVYTHTAFPSSFPFYDILKKEENGTVYFKLNLALSGYDKNNLDITIKDNKLVIKGTASISEENSEWDSVTNGITKKSFEKSFFINKNFKLVNSKFKEGLLSIVFEEKISEKKKERKIEIE